MSAPLYRIGFVASGKRRLKTDGAKYNGYFVGTFQNKRTLVNRNPSTYDTIAEIEKVAAACAYQVKPLAKILTGKTIEETLRNNWQFCYDYIQYVEDDDEEIREPIAIWAQKRADCDCYMTFLSALMRCQGIEHYSDTVKMYGKNHFQHIFAIVPKNPSSFNADTDKDNKAKYWVLDPVMDRFNVEPDQITFKHLTKMGAPLYTISGTGNTNKTNSSAPVRLTFGNEFSNFGISLLQHKDAIAGLGCAADRSATQAQLLADEFQARTKVYLQNTRNRLANATFSGKSEILKAYDSVIANWENPTLRQLEYNKIEGTLGNVFDDAKAAAKRIQDEIAAKAKKALEEAQAAADKVKNAVKDGANSVKTKAEQFGEFLKKINPVSAAVRETIYTLFRKNTGGCSSRLKWAYAPDNIFVLNGQPIANKAKYVEKRDNIAQIIKNMGGTEGELQSAIFAGSTLPQMPSTQISVPLTDGEKQTMLTQMNDLLKDTKVVLPDVSQILVQEKPTDTATKTNTNTAPVADNKPVTTTQSTPVASPPRVDYSNPYLYSRPASAPITITNTSSTGPQYSPTINGLTGVDLSIKDIVQQIWDFIRDLGDDIGQFVKDLWDQLYQGVKVVGLALPRTFFLAMLRLNVDGIANAIAMDPLPFENGWVERFGGQRDAFKSALAAGTQKQPFATGLLKPLAKYLIGQASVKGIRGLRGGPEERTPDYSDAGTNTTNTDNATAENTETKDAIIKATADGAAAYAQALKDNKDLKATLVAVCTAVGTAIGFAVGGIGATLGAPIGAAVGALIALIIGKPKQPSENGEVIIDPTVTPDPDPQPKKSGSNIALWATGLFLAAKALFAGGALSGTDDTTGTKPDAGTDNLSGVKRIQKVII